jgi:hypothetical protein
MNSNSLATDNISHGEITVEAEPRWFITLPTRQFTGRSAYSYEVKRAKNKRGEDIPVVRDVPESTLEQWLFDSLSKLANRIMNESRYKAVSVDEETGEVSEPMWDTMDVQAVAQALVEAVPRTVLVEDWEWGTWKRRDPNAVGRQHLTEMAQRIASARRLTWDAEYVDKVRARASVNGKKSKRPRDNKVFEVLGFPFADHSTQEAKRIIAAALGKSVRTVERHLKDYREAPSVWVPTSQSRYLSQSEPKAPTSTPRYLSRGDQLMALPYEERPRAEPSEPVDWTYLLDIPSAAEASAPSGVERSMDMDKPDVFDRFYAEFNAWQKEWEVRAHGEPDVIAELTAYLDEIL